MNKHNPVFSDIMFYYIPQLQLQVAAMLPQELHK